MEIKVTAGDIARSTADAIVVGCYEDGGALEGATAAVDAALDAAIGQLVSQGEMKGKLNQVTLLHTLGKLPARKVAVVGLGKKTELTLDRVRGAGAVVCRALRRAAAADIAFAPLGAGAADITRGGSAQAIAEGALLGLYAFRKHLTKEAENGEVNTVTLVESDAARLRELTAGAERGRIVAEASNLARDLVNEPANYMTPSNMAEAAYRLAGNYGLEITVLEREQVRGLGMGAFLGVAQGGEQPPKFIVLRYNGRGSAENDIALVGKGITFDSGGISIKPSEGMGEMKGDMSGGAAVMGAMAALAQLKPKINVLAIIAATENMPSGSALKPGDVVTALGGKTIEIISTDAEGRLTLADAIGYARQQGARQVIDIATLTGACVVALGEICTGAFGNNQPLMDRVLAAAKEAGELTWQMPMFDEYKEQNKSDVADIKNTGGRPAGAITAAQFLAEFAGDTPWVHLDIAGTNMTEKEKGYLVKGATAAPLRTLVNLVMGLAST